MANSKILPFLQNLKASDLVVIDLLGAKRLATAKETEFYRNLGVASRDEWQWFFTIMYPQLSPIFYEVAEVSVEQANQVVDTRVRLLPPGQKLDHVFDVDKPEQWVRLD